jgi:transcriptional regulator with XRE-family HTH domain
MSGATIPVQISHQYLSMLLRGEQGNPTLEIIEGLCLFFDVPPAYFFPRLEGHRHEPLAPKSPDHG